MSFEEIYGGRKNLEIYGGFQSTSSAKKKIEEVLKSVSTKDKGFLIWLMNKKADPRPRPFPRMTITLDDLQILARELNNSADDSDDDIDNNDESEIKAPAQNGTFIRKKARKLNDPRKKIAYLRNGFREIKRTSQSVKRNLKSGLYQASGLNGL